MFFEIKDLNVYYGVIHAIKDVSLKIDEGEIITLIGNNGAGKSTILRAVSSVIAAQSGSVVFMDEDITNKKSKDIVKKGIIQVPEGRRIFVDMTVYENLLMGAYLRNDNDIKKDVEKCCEYFPILKQRKNQLAGTLSGGEQQMLAMSRALMAKPKLLLLDEPSMGLAPVLVKEIFKIIKQINEEDKTTILLVEQNANMALSIAKRAYILETGVVVQSGDAKELLNSDEVKKAYLGG